MYCPCSAWKSERSTRSSARRVHFERLAQHEKEECGEGLTCDHGVELGDGVRDDALCGLAVLPPTRELEHELVVCVLVRCVLVVQLLDWVQL